jgi:putative transposase
MPLQTHIRSPLSLVGCTTSVTFCYKDYRHSGPQHQQVMTLDAHEFMRRFLLHVLRSPLLAPC